MAEHPVVPGGHTSPVAGPVCEPWCDPARCTAYRGGVHRSALRRVTYAHRTETTWVDVHLEGWPGRVLALVLSASATDQPGPDLYLPQTPALELAATIADVVSAGWPDQCPTPNGLARPSVSGR